MSKFAPKREDGFMAYVVTKSSWGRTRERVEWAENLKAAKDAYGWTRELYTSIKVRRATLEDVERCS